MSSLVDTTQMYLKTIYELHEDGVPALRARLVERLGHSGPTVSQTVSRLERSGLIDIDDNRSLTLTDTGWNIASETMRRHRLAELFLISTVGLEPWQVHDEACRWEHVMGEALVERLVQIVGDHHYDPFGNRIPEPDEGKPRATQPHVTIAAATPQRGVARFVIERIGEPVQASTDVLRQLFDAGMNVGAEIEVERMHHDFDLAKGGVFITIRRDQARHVFVSPVSEHPSH